MQPSERQRAWQVHERTTDLDLLSLLLKRLLVKHPHVRLIVMSATLQVRAVECMCAESHTLRGAVDTMNKPQCGSQRRRKLSCRPYV